VKQPSKLAEADLTGLDVEIILRTGGAAASA
jgi:hypothetical protein